MTDAVSAAYQVTLPVFEGPLDLLLHLIEREELDITQVSLAQVTNQYLEYLQRLASFLVVAAKLLVIKSRVLLPQPPAPPEPEEEESGDDLVRQLIEYKRFKQAARWLQELEAQGASSYVRIGSATALERAIELEISLEDLVEAMREVLAIKPLAPSVNGAIPPITVSIAEQMQMLERETASGQPVSFRRLLEKAPSRMHVIVALLALLEMIKQLRLTVQQDRLFGEIWIQKRS